MAIVNGVTTKSASLVWKSPDGARELYEVVLDYQGQELKAKTYSTTLINVGWEGDVLVEERQGKQGLETFVKQAPKEDSWKPSGGGSMQSSTGGGTSGSSKNAYVPKDEKAIQAMWAIREANTYFTLESLDMAAVEGLAVEMMDMVDRVKASQSTDTAPVALDVVAEVVDDPLDLSLMDEVLGGKPAVAETPWGKATATPPAS